MPTDRATGRPRGFAFVEFAESDAAAKAIEKYDGHEVNGRKLRVNEAQDRPARPSFGGGSGFGPPKFPKKGKPKGSRKNLRAKKRGF